MALPAVLIVALGSDCWAVAGQSLWQHGPAVLCLLLAMLALGPHRPNRPRLALGGIAIAGMVACRPVDAVFAAVVAGWVITHFPLRDRLSLFVPAACCALALVAYNVWFFRALSGGYSQIEAQHLSMHGVKGTWTGSFFTGAAGTLASPSHGLLIFSPWISDRGGVASVFQPDGSSGARSLRG